MLLTEVGTQKYDIGRAAVFRRAVWDGTDNLFDTMVHIGNTEGEISIATNGEYSELTLETSGPAAIKRFFSGERPEFELGIFPTEAGLALFTPVARGTSGLERRRVAREHTLWIVPEELFLKADAGGNMVEVPIAYAGGVFLKDGLALTAEEQRLLDLSLIIWRADFSRATPLFKHDDGGKSLRSVTVRVQQDFTKPDGAQLYLVAGEVADFDLSFTPELPSYDLFYLDWDGESTINLGSTQLGGAQRWAASEVLPQMIDAPMAGTNHASDGKALSQMLAAFSGYSRPAQPPNTFKGIVFKEFLAEAFLIGNFNPDSHIAMWENLILAAVDTGFYTPDAIFVCTPTPSGYNGTWDEVAVPVAAYLRAGVVVNAGHAGHPVGSPLGITVVDLMADPAFAPGGLRLSVQDETDTYVPDGTNTGGILSPEMTSYYDFSGVHPTGNGSFVTALLVRQAIQSLANVASKAPTSIDIEYLPRGIGTAWTPGTPTVQLGFPLAVRAVAKTAGVADPDFDLLAIWRKNLQIEFGNDNVHFFEGVGSGLRQDHGVVYPKAAGSTGEIIARHGALTAEKTIDVTAGINTPFWIQRMRVGWGETYASLPWGEGNDRYGEANVRGLLQPGWHCETTSGGMVVGERVVSLFDARDPAHAIEMTVPAGKVGPILRREAAGTIYPHADFGFWRYWLEFDSEDAALESPLLSAWDLASAMYSYMTASVTHPVVGAPQHGLKIHNAADTEVLAIDFSGASPRLYVKTATQDGYEDTVDPWDRITGFPKRFFKIRLLDSGADQIAKLYVLQPFAGTIAETDDVIVTGGFTAENKRLTIGNVGFMEWWGFGAVIDEPAGLNQHGWYHQNASQAHGSNAGSGPPAPPGGFTDDFAGDGALDAEWEIVAAAEGATFARVGGQFACTNSGTASDDENVCVRESGLSDGTFEITVATHIAAWAAVFRYQDVDNYWKVVNSGTYWTFHLRLAGGHEEISFSTVAPANGDVVRVELNGPLIDLYVNDVLRISIDRSELQSATKYGWRPGGDFATSRADNCSMVA